MTSSNGSALIVANYQALRMAPAVIFNAGPTGGVSFNAGPSAIESIDYEDKDGVVNSFNRYLASPPLGTTFGFNTLKANSYTSS